MSNADKMFHLNCNRELEPLPFIRPGLYSSNHAGHHNTRMAAAQVLEYFVWALFDEGEDVPPCEDRTTIKYRAKRLREVARDDKDEELVCKWLNDYAGRDCFEWGWDEEGNFGLWLEK